MQQEEMEVTLPLIMVLEQAAVVAIFGIQEHHYQRMLPQILQEVHRELTEVHQEDQLQEEMVLPVTIINMRCRRLQL